VPIAGTPAAKYLDGLGVAGDVRWLRKTGDWHAAYNVGRPPAWSAGAIAYRHQDANGPAVAVQLDGLDADGKQSGERWRRNAGAISGSWFVAGDGGCGAGIAEGPKTAMAAMKLGKVAVCHSAGGAGLMAAVAENMPEREHVHVYADEPGFEGARRCASAASKHICMRTRRARPLRGRRRRTTTSAPNG